MKTFNINDIIKVKLTDFGYKVLVNNYNDYTNTDVNADFFKEQTDNDGYYNCQLHELMNIFGEHLINGSPLYFINNEILIP